MGQHLIEIIPNLFDNITHLENENIFTAKDVVARGEMWPDQETLLTEIGSCFAITQAERNAILSFHLSKACSLENSALFVLGGGINVNLPGHN